MATFEELDALTSEQLHDRAVTRAEHHLDVKFFWRMLEAVPVAEAAADDTGEARADVLSSAMQLQDAVNQSPEVRDALRPLYIEYLLEHTDG